MSDNPARRLALDPAQSWLVEAPAGSGKTELLIQRYLALLLTVQQPEQVVAMTFTRKAAAEMRARVLAAITGTETQPRADRTTADLAGRVLVRDRSLEWGLAEQPQRLRIDTLDALNGALARQLPLLSGNAADAAIVEHPARYYRAAAERALEAMLAADAEPLRRLARGRGNDLTGLTALLAELLPRRDQWLRHLLGSSDAALRADLERALERLADETLEKLARELDPSELALAAEIVEHASRSSVDGLETGALGMPARPSRLVPRGLVLDKWRLLARLMLTDSGAWRRRAPARYGFDAGSPARREQWQRLRDAWQSRAGVETALHRVALLPDIRYRDSQWGSLLALRAVLVRTAAELTIIFAEHNVIDFVELALRAQRALGSTEQPSELLLAFDRRIEHILVDEFQDTSHQQLRLLELLTSGWSPDDGRTLFFVGDPMQSIYRFRDADLSLFLSVGTRGLGDVSVGRLRLAKNFRSAPALVKWVNSVFGDVFPQADDLEAGAARFSESEPARSSLAGQGVRVHALRGDDQALEIARVADIVEEELAREPGQSLGILAQSRPHLRGLAELLRLRGRPAHAIEIDAFETRQLGQDLIGLARALTHLGDRIAWLGLLRAPWCGLIWRDLAVLSPAEDRRTVWELMHDPERLEALSPDGRGRLETLRAELVRIFERRASFSFARWLEHAWRALGGDACVDSAAELDIAASFFRALNELGNGQDIDDPTTLGEMLSGVMIDHEPPREAGVEIMTIHRAKGLEFDTVILLGLGREPPPAAERALHWAERIASDGRRDLLLAPPAFRDRSGPDPLGLYLRRLDRERELAERRRLLYVAVTRARERLHLVARLSPSAKKPAPRSLLAPLWPHLEQAFPAPVDSQPNGSAAARPRAAVEPLLRRRRVMQPARPQPAAQAPTVSQRPPFEWAGHTAASVGTLVHSELQRMAAGRGQSSPPAATPRTRAALYRRELALLGVEPAQLEAAVERTIAALGSALADPRGRWILEPHAEARSELGLTVNTSRGLGSLKIDRSFVDGGARWIIDFKTSTHEGGGLEAFLTSEVERYQAQLEQYAEALSRLDTRPIRLGLYFPLLPAFCSWRYGEPATSFRTD